MEQARVSEAVWSRLLRLRAAGATNPSAGWTAGERAAWALYAPLAAARGPFLFAQVGQSLDGRVATVSGDARDVSGADGLRHLHRCRALADAVVVGVRTALHDNPRLTCRLVAGPNPVRVVIDPSGRLPDDAAVLRDDGTRRIVIQATDTARPDGVEVVRLPALEGVIAPGAIQDALRDRGLFRILIEGGGITISRFLEAGLLHRLHVAVAPLIIGAGPSGVSTSPVRTLAEALRPETRVFGLETDVVFDCLLNAEAEQTVAPGSLVVSDVPRAAVAARRA